MKTTTEMIAELKVRLQNIPSKDSIRIPDDGSFLSPGQLWSVKGGCGMMSNGEEALTWNLMVLNHDGAGKVKVIPVFHWGELAGPKDVYIPGRLTNQVDMVACIDQVRWVSSDLLEKCFGRFSTDFTTFLNEVVWETDNGQHIHRWSWGPSYFGPHDHRLEYHEEIAKKLTTCG